MISVGVQSTANDGFLNSTACDGYPNNPAMVEVPNITVVAEILVWQSLTLLPKSDERGKLPASRT